MNRNRVGQRVLVGPLLAVSLGMGILLWGPVNPCRAEEPAADGAAQSKPVPKRTWMDDVDVVFGDYVVTPFEKVLYFDFWTHEFQMSHYRKMDADGDKRISRAEATGRLLGAVRRRA